MTNDVMLEKTLESPFLPFAIYQDKEMAEEEVGEVGEREEGG